MKYPTEFLNSLDTPRLPSHKRMLKMGIIVILEKNEILNMDLSMVKDKG